MNKITEKHNKGSINIDSLPSIDILKIINQEDSLIHSQIKNILPSIDKMISAIIHCLKNNGKLIYIGCGTSGRLGVLDAAECPPTFSTSDEVQAFIAGGYSALHSSAENAEDSVVEGINLINKKINKNDFVLGISASGGASFVNAALKQAKKIGASTGLLTCNNINNNPYFDHLICVVVGPEIITGSTRMKAGTATKMILNMISTTSMIKLNKTYGNIMVDLKISNQKLLDRGIRIISEITAITYIEAAEILKKSKNNVKAAIIMKINNISLKESIKLLKINDGNLREIIG